MRKELIDILVCPVCREKLELGVDDENERGGSKRLPVLPQV